MGRVGRSSSSVSGAFVLGVYVLVVLGGGVLIGRTDSPSPALSVLATTVVALAFAPVQRVLERAAARHIATPYDVLTRFAENVGDEDGTEDLPARMSRLLAQGTGAQWAQVWLQVSGRLTMAGRWPVDARDDSTPPVPGKPGVTAGHGRTACAPRRSGTATRCWVCSGSRSGPGLPLTAVEERLFTDLASQAGLVLRLVGLRAELEDRHHELQARTRELESSRGTRDRGPGRRAQPAGARHPRRRPTTSGGPGHEPAARPGRRAAGHPTGRARCWPSRRTRLGSPSTPCRR